jgi:hypothetical protein
MYGTTVGAGHIVGDNELMRTQAEPDWWVSTFTPNISDKTKKQILKYFGL